MYRIRSGTLTASAALRTLSCGVALALIACREPTAPSLEPDAGVLTASVKSEAPSNLWSTAVTRSRIDLGWQDNSTNESGFEIERSTAGAGGPFTKLATTGRNVASYQDHGLTAHTTYCYRVRAFRATGNRTATSGWSNVSCATTPGPPAAATNATSRPVNSTMVEVGWRDESSIESGFRVERSATGSDPWTAVATTSPNVTWHNDGGLTPDAPVCYRVIAFNAHGDADPSNVACTTPPAAPTGLTATAIDGPAIELQWRDNSAVEDGFEVQKLFRQSYYCGGYGYGYGYGYECYYEYLSTIATLPPGTTTYRDPDVAPGQSHSYVVFALKDGGRSDVSNWASAEVPAPAP